MVLTMDSSPVALQALIADAIAHQLGRSEPDEVTEKDELIHETAERLLDEALASGKIHDASVIDMSSFTAGNSSMMVARLVTDLSFVVKIDTNPDVVVEADVLRRAGEDTSLPEATRKAFPRIFAVDRVGPIYGYLMEDLTSCSPLHELLATADTPLKSQLLIGLWRELLEPAYRATRSVRLIPNIAEDYFDRARRRLASAADKGLMLGPADRIELVDEGGVCQEFAGWGSELDQATAALAEVAPPFGTFVHGDPNPENVLIDRSGSNLRFRLLDPKNWWLGDYLFDAAKLLHYVRVTGPAEQIGLKVARGFDHGVTTIQFDRSALTTNAKVEDEVLDVIAGFADSPEIHDNPNWRVRYRLAVAANLLGIVGPRVEKGQEDIALIALGEGLRELRRALQMLDGATA